MVEVVEEVEATGFFFVFAQLSHALGNKAEMEITSLLEHNPSLMRLGLFFEFNDARSRVATLLQKNLDRSKWATEPKLVKKKRKRNKRHKGRQKEKKMILLMLNRKHRPSSRQFGFFFLSTEHSQTLDRRETGNAGPWTGAQNAALDWPPPFLTPPPHFYLTNQSRSVCGSTTVHTRKAINFE